jgi:hypothetical protein
MEADAHSGGVVQQATIVTLAVPGDVALQALLLARSIRDFGGSLAAEPIWAMVPDGGPRMKRSIATAFEDLGVRLVPFPIEPEVARIPFAVKAVAGARAEESVDTDLLVWLDPDVLMVGSGREFLIPEGAVLGYRPVHHRLIGIDADLPIDAFWQAVLEGCGASEDRLFRMYTNVGERIRAYINAGVFVVRPEAALLQKWLEALVPLSSNPSITTHTRHDELYSIFLHQAVWTAVLLANLPRIEMLQLSPAVNYPLELHDRIPAGRRALSLQRLTAVRTEDLLFDPEWKERVPILGSLAPWLETQPLMMAK